MEEERGEDGEWGAQCAEDADMEEKRDGRGPPGRRTSTNEQRLQESVAGDHTVCSDRRASDRDAHPHGRTRMTGGRVVLAAASVDGSQGSPSHSQTIPRLICVAAYEGQCTSECVEQGRGHSVAEVAGMRWLSCRLMEAAHVAAAPTSEEAVKGVVCLRSPLHRRIHR